LTELVSTRIRTTAVKLGLPHLAETLTEYTQRADEAKLGYLDFLDLVLSEELAVRDDRRFRTGLRISKLPHHKTIEDYDFSFQPDLDPRKVKDLATLSFVEANAALLGASDAPCNILIGTLPPPVISLQHHSLPTGPSRPPAGSPRHAPGPRLQPIRHPHDVKVEGQ
jgi:hypothetical protein